MAANLDWPLIFKRQYAGALDADEVMQDLSTLDTYISSSGLAYEGQIVYIKDESAPYKIDDDGAGNLIRNPVDTGSGSISASQISYSLNDAGDWDGSPTQVNTALDELADRLRTHENATGNVHNTTLEQVRAQDNTITGGPINMGFLGIENVNFIHADLTGGNQSFQIGNAATTSGGFFFNTKNAADNASITAMKIDNGDTSLVKFKSGVGINKVLDEDDLISNDVQALATQQSIKAYVDSNSTAIAGGSVNQVQYNDGSNGFAANSQGKYHPTEEAWTYGYRSGTVGNFSVVLGGANTFENIASGDYSIAGGRNNNVSGLAAVGLGRDTQSTNNYTFGSGIGLNISGNTASGFGNNNISSGSQSFVTGRNVIASADNSVSGGFESNAYLLAQFARSSGQFSTNGDAQYSALTAFNATTDATTTELFLDGGTAPERLILPNNTNWEFTIRINARRTDTVGEDAAYEFKGLIVRNANAASTTLKGNTKEILHEDVVGWDAVISADTTNGALKIEVTGEAAKTIQWVAKVSLVENAG